MNSTDATLTTGLPELDKVLKGILIGDNIVWQIDSADEYHELVTPFCRAALTNGSRLIYFRYARHQALVTENEGAEVHELDPEQGFEHFIEQICAVIEEAGPGTFYVFDCLSRLAVDWYSDEMLGNFFMLTCPHLFDMETVAYFALYRNYHTSRAVVPIQNTTQLFVDVYRHRGDLYVRPIKVLHRYSPTMNMLHVRRGESFSLVTSSAVTSEIMTSAKWSGLNSDSSLGFWESSFLQAQELMASGDYRPDLPERGKNLYEKLVRMVVSRDAGMQKLIARYLTLQDILDIRKRMIGTGLIGGKTVGMLLACAIVKGSDTRFVELMEAQDSFFIGSDAFFSFLVSNGIWWVRQNQRDPDKFLEGADEARRRIITGTFSAHIMKQFEEMLDYFGQSPFIVRSSSLLEDNFGNSFAGKYESVFCVNQGPRERRMQDFLAAVKRIYASSMSEQALRYRARRGMLERDEQMALLVMRVSGTMHGRRFYPEIAGVGFSFNPYAWHESIDPQAGVIRLVFGLGTRAVDQADDDHTRIVALNAPDKRPEANFDEVAQYTQRRVDYLDLEANQLVSGYFEDVTGEASGLPLDVYTSIDRSLPRDAPPRRILTFEQLLSKTSFVNDLREILDTIETAYDYPVDIEFTANFMENGEYRINLLQCRPLQAKGSEAINLPEINVPVEDRIVEARGAVVGQSRLGQIGRFIYIVPERYAQLPVNTRYEIARLIGDINRAEKENVPENVMIIGPGRWGTSSPSLGIPVSFCDINTVTILCEIVAMHDTLVPDVSLGTHFLNELVELDMLYLALFPDKGQNYLNTAFFEEAPNRLLDLVPSAGKWADTVRVIDAADVAGRGAIRIVADALGQTVSCHFVPVDS
ncbi:PEP/pyruvate-binding domain-containing protein [Tichowtungia aerotolerans]|uniref:Phosphoenolpyruvate synthase n=1 Tax=Tichowtungia aerotolerans TaxID=2697043 RepID=A0A6P1M5P4_9BACT|nr:PEP/pyruvate-binding domain-containing protein [Tichowtungia aerotolerans]QHI69362.1 pyruvate, phosphate dikinase [Tichowtungia aerotolerans]